MKQEIILNKIYALPELLKKVQVWRFQGKKIVFTNGCFDVLHTGHLTLLNQSASITQNAILIVGLNSDSSITKLKGDSRPILNFEERSLFLASLYAVDAVIQFDEETPLNLIQAIKPNILIKGGDYSKENIIGTDLVNAYGGIVEMIPIVDGYSTTKFIQKLLQKK